MRYEFIVLDENFKNNSNTFHNVANGDVILNFSDMIAKNRRLKYPIAIYINGVLMNPTHYKFEEKIITVSKNYKIYPTDRVYLIFASSNYEKAGYIIQYKVNDYTISDEYTLTLVEPLIVGDDEEVLGVTVNGVLYSTELFSMTDTTITFNEYTPENGDIVSLLVLRR